MPPRADVHPGRSIASPSFFMRFQWQLISRSPQSQKFDKRFIGCDLVKSSRASPYLPGGETFLSKTAL